MIIFLEVKEMFKRIKKMIQRLKMSRINITSYFITKDPDIWVFGAIRGEKYMDNAKYLFEYVNANTEIVAVWLSNDLDVISQLNTKGYKAFNMHSKEGLAYAMRAKIAVITHRGVNEKSDLPFYAFTKKTKIIQLWHGIPLKKIAFDDKIHSFIQDESKLIYKVKQQIKRIFFPYTDYVNHPALIPALSSETKKIFSQAFRIDPNKVVITGYPRNDFMVQSVDRSQEISNIIYMPTFRDESGSGFDLFMDYDFKVDELDSFFQEKGIKLYIKLHPFNQPTTAMLKEIESSKNIVFLEVDDIYEVLHTFDMLITDYSSIYFDFLLLDRPIIFAPFDKEIYLKKDREFYFDYDEVTPGPKAENWYEVIDSIAIFLDNPDKFKTQRISMKSKFHSYADNQSSKRIIDYIVNL